MSTPNDFSKSAKFSAEVHEALMALGRDLGETADGALRHLLGLSTICIPVSEVQRERWTAAAAKIGVPVDEFVRSGIEMGLRYDTTPAAMYEIYAGVYELCRERGLNPPMRIPYTSGARPPAAPKDDTTP